MLEDISGRELIRYCGEAKKIEISSSVEVIGSCCFMNCQSPEHLRSRSQSYWDSTHCRKSG
jgi:hypothetical protein